MSTLRDVRKIVGMVHDGASHAETAIEAECGQATVWDLTRRARRRPCTVEHWNAHRHPKAAALDAFPFRDHRSLADVHKAVERGDKGAAE